MGRAEMREGELLVCLHNFRFTSLIAVLHFLPWLKAESRNGGWFRDS